MAKHIIDAEHFDARVREAMGMAMDDLPMEYQEAVQALLAMLKTEPSVYVPRWIPVTERLPKLYTDVLLSVRQSYAFGEADNWCIVGELIDKADIAWVTNYGFHDTLYSNGKHTVWVSAWMPLPTPYKGGEWE